MSDLALVIVSGVGSAAVAGALVYSARETRTLREQYQLERDTAERGLVAGRAANDLSLMELMMRLARLCVDAPELAPYFYEQWELPEDPMTRTRVLAVASYIVNLADSVSNMMRLEQLDDDNRTAWRVALRRFAASPAVQHVVRRNPAVWLPETAGMLLGDDAQVTEATHVDERTIDVGDQAPYSPDASSLGYYDVRAGAAGYAPIIGTIGGFVVTAVVLVFGIIASHSGHVEHVALFEHASSFLVLGLIGSLLGALAFAAIGAEQLLTADLPAASLYAGVTTAIGAEAILAAFDALATAYLPKTASLFALITAGTGIAAAVLVALVLGDAWVCSPPNHWLGTPEKAYRQGSVASILVVSPILAAGAMYLFAPEVLQTSGSLHVVIGAGIILAVFFGLASMFRTMRLGYGA